MQTPCSDYRESKGLIYFARMLDKIRLNAEERLAPGYFLGVEDPTFFDARCTRFLGVDYDELAARTLQGGSDEEILDWCFAHGKKSGEEEIEIWNAFISKRGWRDAGSDWAGQIAMIFKPGWTCMMPKKEERRGDFVPDRPWTIAISNLSCAAVILRRADDEGPPGRRLRHSK
jgi:gluconokinase